jgi:REP element-mobilizing transposase RayT
MELPARKPNRLRNYDYSNDGMYFVTVCTHEKQCLLWTDGACPKTATDVPLSEIGIVTRDAILSIPTHYPGVTVEQYVVMPNHVHILVGISNVERATRSAPALSRVIGQWKRYVSKLAGRPIWQRSFYDHIIRGEADYQEIQNYIEQNPAKWTEDRFYCRGGL